MIEKIQSNIEENLKMYKIKKKFVVTKYWTTNKWKLKHNFTITKTKTIFFK